MNYISARLSKLNDILYRIKTKTQNPGFRRWTRIARVVLGLGVVALLVSQLMGIGWRELWISRPRTPWFYVIWVLLYVQLMFVELGIYGRLWPVRLKDLWPVLFRKRVLNTDVVSYSGEAYFFLWAQKHVPQSSGQLLGTIKDNAIASMLGSWAAAIVLVAVFLFAGQITLVDLVGTTTPLYLAGGAVLVAIGISLLTLFRRAVLTLPTRTVLTLFGVHVGRFLIIIYFLQIAQWWVVLPEAPISVWATMLVIITVANRLPLIPAKDILGVGAVLGISSLLDASEAVIAAMLMTHLALNKTANLLLFAGTSMADRIREKNSRQVREDAMGSDEYVAEGYVADEHVVETQNFAKAVDDGAGAEDGAEAADSTGAANGRGE